MMKKNIVLIGMPASGKSTLGKLLAEKLAMPFLDTDDVLQEYLGEPLQKTINEEGIDYFLQKEEEAVLSIKTENTIIATGGSVIYSTKAMMHLKSHGFCVFLSVPYGSIAQRLNNLSSRGVALPEGKTLKDLHAERTPLYLSYGDIIFFEPNHDGDPSIEEHTEMLISFLREQQQLG